MVRAKSILIVYIYGLKDADGIIRYVGKTVNIKRRMYQHDRYNSWYTGYEIFEEANEINWEEREMYWISYYRESSGWLINQTDGGDGMHGRALSDETKKKISEALRGRKFTKRRKSNISKSKIGRCLSEDHKAAISAGLKGYVKSEEHRANLSKSISKFYSRQ